MKDFDLPVPNQKKEEFIQNHLQDHHDIVEENDLSVEKANMFYEANYPLLNKDQQDVFNYIKDLIVGKNKDGLLIFLDAPGGTGKTFTLNVLVTWMIKENLKVAISAASGIAATLLFLGQTTHHRFKLPLTPHKDSVCNFKKESEIGRFLSEISLGIIDEGPMLNKLYLEAVDCSLKDLVPAEDKEKKFGGKIILVSGDFRQLLPVLEKASRAEIVNHTLKNSVTLWDNKVIKLQLRQNMRVKKEMEKFPHDRVLHEELQTHEQFLLDLGEGKLPAHATVDGYNLIEIPSSMCQTSKEEVIEKVFDDFQSHIGDMEYFQGRVLLATTNKIVDEVNEEMVERIPGDLHTFHSIDTVTDIDNSTMFPTEFLNSLNLSGLPEHTLKLKRNTVVILLRNMDIYAGHCNGTRYLVKTIGQYRVILHKLDAKGDDKNNVLILPRIPCHYGGRNFPFELTRLQFPLKIAFALTINRAQGQSAQKCGILLPKNVWTHGQVYVAFSRCGNPRNIFVWADQSHLKDSKGKRDPGKQYLKNVVYKEVLT